MIFASTEKRNVKSCNPVTCNNNAKQPMAKKCTSTRRSVFYKKFRAELKARHLPATYHV